jgi:hypothetical protein
VCLFCIIGYGFVFAQNSCEDSLKIKDLKISQLEAVLHDSLKAMRAELSGFTKYKYFDNSVYLDLIGPGIFYSFNYERRIKVLSKKNTLGIRGGFQYMSIEFVDATDTLRFDMAFPFGAYYLLSKRAHHFESGCGVTFTKSLFQESILPEHVLPYVLCGYRFLRPGGQFIFRIGLSFLYIGGKQMPVFPLPYISSGFSF